MKVYLLLSALIGAILLATGMRSRQVRVGLSILAGVIFRLFVLSLAGTLLRTASNPMLTSPSGSILSHHRWGHI